MLKGKDNRQSYIVAPAVPEKDEALRATLRAEKAMKIKKDLTEMRLNGTIIHADIHSSDDCLNNDDDDDDDEDNVVSFQHLVHTLPKTLESGSYNRIQIALQK